MKAMRVSHTLFHPYDIRGRVPETLNAAVAKLLGRAFGNLLRSAGDGEPTVAVGRDMRLSSPELAEAVADGLRDAGCDVVLLGLTSTPTFYGAVALFEYAGGVQVTASHNPKGDNGLKFVGRHGRVIDRETGLAEIERLANAPFAAQARGTLAERTNVTEEVVAKESEGYDAHAFRSVSVVADAGNGMAALDLEAFFARTRARVTKLNFTLDGNFPGRGPDPSKDENLRAACEQVKKERADVGIATDGDGDRYFLIDEMGAVVPHQILRGLVAQWVLRDNKGALVCLDVRPGKVTEEMVLAAGGRIRRTPVGSPFIKRIMDREGAPVGVESSGHYFFKKPFGTFEMPAVFLSLLLRFLSESKQPLSQLIAPYKKYAHSGELNIAVQHPAEAIERVAKAFPDGKQDRLDGISIAYDDWWMNLRPSNTEPLVRLIVEAVSDAVMTKQRDAVLALVQPTT